MLTRTASGPAALEKALLRPSEYPGLIRLGPSNDGAYVVPGDQIAPCRYLLSLGLSHNWSFDQDFLTRSPGARVVGVDHTVGALWAATGVLVCLWKVPAYALIGNFEKSRKYRERIAGYRRFLSFYGTPNRHVKKRVSDDGGRGDISVTELLHAMPPVAPHDVFLKMDIEGSEYGVIPDIVAHQDRIRCIAAELHEIGARAAEFNPAMRALLEHFALVHVHENNCAPYDAVNDFPATIEATFVNKAVIGRTLPPSTVTYPRPGLDAPNDPSVPDHPLRFA